MNEEEKQIAILTVLGRRLLEQRLPMLLRIQARLVLGEVLSDYDIRFLKEVFTDTQNNMPLLDQHPEFQSLSVSIMYLYKEIMQRAAENENSRK